MTTTDTRPAGRPLLRPMPTAVLPTHYRPEAPRLSADRAEPAAADVLTTIGLLLGRRECTSAEVMEAICQYVDDYERRLAGTPGAWPSELGRTSR